MQSAILLDQLVAGTHMKVVGIGKFYLSTDLAQVIGRYSAFNSAYSSYIHENRCLDGSMYSFHLGTFRPSIFGYYLIFHILCLFVCQSSLDHDGTFDPLFCISQPISYAPLIEPLKL